MRELIAQRFNRLRQLPCCQCGAIPVQIAHSNFSKHAKGRGIKADDKYTIPLCYSCHRRFDTYDMGMSRAESEEWFDNKLRFINEVLDGADDKTVL